MGDTVQLKTTKCSWLINDNMEINKQLSVVY